PAGADPGRSTRSVTDAKGPAPLNLPFDPNVHVGPIQLAWHGIFTAVGIFFGVWLPVRVLRGRVSEDALYAVATPAVVGGLRGAPGICVTYDHPDSLGQGPAFAPGDPRYAPGPVHLAVGYEMLWDLAGVALALALRRRFTGRPPEGRIFWLWLAFQSLGRFLISFLLVDKVGLFGLYQPHLA